MLNQANVNETINNQVQAEYSSIAINPETNENAIQELQYHEFMLPILFYNQDILTDRRGYFQISSSAYEQVNEEESKKLDELNKILFEPFRLVDIKGYEGKAYYIEQLDPKTGNVLSRSAFLMSNLKDQDITELLGEFRHSGVKCVMSENREVGLMFEQRQNQLLREGMMEGNEKIRPIHHGAGYQTKFGYIYAGVGLIYLHDVFAKRSEKQIVNIKNMTAKMRNKRNKVMDEDDNFEWDEVKADKTYKPVIFEPVDNMVSKVKQELNSFLEAFEQASNLDLSDLKHEVIDNKALNHNFENPLPISQVVSSLVQDHFDPEAKSMIQQYRKMEIELGIERDNVLKQKSQLEHKLIPENGI